MQKSTINEFVRGAEKKLAAAGIDSAPLDTRLLVAHVLHLDRVQLISQSDRILTDEEARELDALIARRATREPVSRILGHREFWGLEFKLNEATLVPRPDSETLIEAALKEVKRTSALRILDLGTGSGCLLLALLHELPNATGLGIDSAPRAVEQAMENADHLGLSARAAFKLNDWAQGLTEHFDIVVSNPPYVAHGEIPALMPEVRAHDPHLALDGGNDGLNCYRLLIPQLPDLLTPNGLALFEIGEGQANAVYALFEKTGFQKILIRRDLAGTERCVAASALS